MKAKDIRELSVEQINKKIAALKDELFNLRFQAALGTAENPSKMKELKKDIARMLTVLTEKENAAKK